MTNSKKILISALSTLGAALLLVAAVSKPVAAVEPASPEPVRTGVTVWTGPEVEVLPEVVVSATRTSPRACGASPAKASPVRCEQVELRQGGRPGARTVVSCG